MGLLIPYLLYPIGLAACLKRWGWSSRNLILIPLSLGLGPLCATFVLELFLMGHPGAGQRALMEGILLIGGGALLWLGRMELKSLLKLDAFTGPLIINALLLLVVAWLLCGNNILFSWDPVCYRLVADRIVAEGVISPHALILEPTYNELLFVHPFHGPRYLLLLAFNRVFLGEGHRFFDSLPAVWYMWSLLWLVAGAVAGERGWRGIRPWLAVALMLTAYPFIYWPFQGKVSSVNAFGAFALFVCCLQAVKPAVSDHKRLIRWLVAGACLGLVMGFHRTNLILPFICVVFALAGGALVKKRVFLNALAGAGAALIAFLPYGGPNILGVGGLDAANPVSNGLVPYRMAWRDAFEAQPLMLAFEQFFKWGEGALLWSGALLVGITCLVFILLKRRSIAKEDRPAVWAGAVSIIFLAVILSDMFLLFYQAGIELMVRSSRYRIVLVPFLSYAMVMGLHWLRQKPETEPSTEPRPGWVPLLGGMLVWAAFFSTTAMYMPHLLPQSLADVPKTINRTVARSDREMMAGRAGNGELLQYFEENPTGEGFTLLDYIPLAPFMNTPLRSSWLNPGTFFLLDAETPRAAFEASRENGLQRMVYVTNQGDDVLPSATGLRHFLSLQTAGLAFEADRYQVFQLRDQFLEEPIDVSGLLNRPVNDETQDQMLLKKPLREPGDYELLLDFESKETITIRRKSSLKGRNTVYQLRAWRPHIPGPHRLRFKVARGERVTLAITKPGSWDEIKGMTLLVVQP